MAESKRRPRKLKGAVLIMVVTLLFVLVVMLLATLTVVSNENRRTITKYEENQAYYTARSALEVYINEMLEDQAKISDDSSFGTDGSDIKSAWEDITPVGSSSQVFVFDTPDADSMATNLSSDKDFTGNDITKGFIHQQEIFCYLTPKYVIDPSKYDASTGAPDFLDPKSENIWKKTSEISTSSYSENDSYIEYVAVLPKTSISGNELGKLADDSNSDNMGEVHIKIELLRMLYKDSNGNILFDGSYVSQNTNNLDGACVKMSAIDWNQTYYRLKVTATTSVSDSTGGSNESTVSVLLEPSTQVSPAAFTNAMTSFEGAANANKANIIGGSSADDKNEIYTMQNTPAILTGRFVYNYKGVKSPNSINWTFPSDGYFVNRHGWLGFNNMDTTNYIKGSGRYDTTDTNVLNSRPFIYSAGIYSDNQMYIGNEDNACDIVVAQNGTLGAEKNIISNSAKLAFISGNGTEIYGDVYCDGDMYLKNSGSSCIFNGDVYCTGNIYIESNEKVKASYLEFKGNVYIGGSVLHSDGSLYEWIGDVNGLSSASPCTMGSLSIEESRDNEAVSLTLPKRTITVASTITETTNYRDQTDITKLISASDMLKKNLGNKNVKLSLTGTNYLEMKKNSGFETKEIDGTTYDRVFVAKDEYYNSNTYCYEFLLDLNQFSSDDSTVYYIDATKGTVQIQLKGNQNVTNVFVVLGDYDVVVTVPDDTTVCHKGLQIWTKEIYDLYKSDGTFVLGDEGYFEKLKETTGDDTLPNSPSSPKIYYYFGKNSVFQTSNGDNSLFCGYFYGPEARYESNKGSSTTIKYTYNGSSELSANVSIIGSIVFKSISTDNNFGIAFQAPGGGGESSMIGTMITWDRQRYLGS